MAKKSTKKAEPKKSPAKKVAVSGSDCTNCLCTEAKCGCECCA
jgi:hypothetical protein